MRRTDKQGLYLVTGLLSLTTALSGCGARDDQDPMASEQTFAGKGGGSGPLSSVSVPRIQGGDIIDQAAALRLGKALFWDMQTGGDGQIACATCHYHGGADTRHMNTLNPGPDGIFASGGVNGPGQLWNGASITNDDRVGSQGLVGSIYQGPNPDTTVAADLCTPDHTAPFFAVRRVTGRNTPSAVGAVFFRDLFWDGRANHVFNGNDPFGPTGNGGGALALQNAGLASQSVGPPGSSTEMSCAGRPFNGHFSLGTKLLARPPLQFQQVSPNDSVLGGLSAWPGSGLAPGNDYPSLIAAAFGHDLAVAAEDQFSRIWGQAIAAYEATLIPDQTPFDRYQTGDRGALTASQQQGLDVFSGKGSCTKCHAGPELSDATISFAQGAGLINEDGGDQGFHNLGVRPTAEDLGRAGLGPKQVSYSVSGSVSDRGAFKTPSLRNVKLTAPYFHNGGKSTLADVVDFYSRGGDFQNPEKARRIKPLGLDARDQGALVDFLTNALTDCRTEMEQAPFDHPSLPVPNGPSLPAVGAAGLGACR